MNTIEMALLKEVMDNIARIAAALERMADANEELVDINRGELINGDN